MNKRIASLITLAFSMLLNACYGGYHGQPMGDGYYGGQQGYYGGGGYGNQRGGGGTPALPTVMMTEANISLRTDPNAGLQTGGQTIQLVQWQDDGSMWYRVEIGTTVTSPTSDGMPVGHAIQGGGWEGMIPPSPYGQFTHTSGMVRASGNVPVVVHCYRGATARSAIPVGGFVQNIQDFPWAQGTPQVVLSPSMCRQPGHRA